jgi:hypothetical protein
MLHEEKMLCPHRVRGYSSPTPSKLQEVAMSQYPPPGGGDVAPPPPPPPPPGDGGAEDSLPQRRLSEILGSAFAIYRNNAAQLLTIVALIVVPLSVVSFLVARVALGVKTKHVLIGQNSVKVLEPRSFWVFVLAALVAAAIGVITTAILQAAILRGAAQATIGDPVDVSGSYRWGLHRFGSVLLVSILVGLVVAVGFILLIIPGIIFLVFLSVSVPALVVEGRRGRDAMRRSWNLVSGHFWHVFGVVIVAAIITGIIGGIFSAIGGGNRIVGLIFGTIGQVIVAPYSALVAVLLYLDLRARKESLTATALRAELQSDR